MSVSVFVAGTVHDLDDVFNVSNTNFRRLMDLLGVAIDPHVLAGDFAGAALVALADQVRFALASVQAMPALDGGVPPTVRVGALGARAMDMGLRPAYFTDRLTALLALVEQAIAAEVPLCYG